MDLADLRKIALKEKIPQAIIEKDYVLSVALHELFKSTLQKHIIFKGGTALKKIYFPEARFSEDLDFTVIGLTKSEILVELRNLFENKRIQNVLFIVLEEAKTREGLRLAIKFRFVLGQEQRIRFDFSFRGNLISAPVEKEIIDNYSIGKSVLKVLIFEEMFAEKIHALGSRIAPRDLYDVWFLFGQGLAPDKGMIEKKFAYYHEKLDLHKIEANFPQMKGRWHQDLRQLMSNVPDFDQVSKEVLEKLIKST